MAGDDGKPSKKSTAQHEETLQIRVRAKNPLIERKKSNRDDRGDSNTVAAGPGFVDPATIRGESVTVAELAKSLSEHTPDFDTDREHQALPKSIYERLEQTDRTDEEIKLAVKELADLSPTERVVPEAPVIRAPIILEETKELPKKKEEVHDTQPVERGKVRKVVSQQRKKTKKMRSPQRVDKPAPRPSAPVYVDEDETLIASGPPLRVGALEDVKSDSGDEPETKLLGEGVGPTISTAPTERPEPRDPQTYRPARGPDGDGVKAVVLTRKVPKSEGPEDDDPLDIPDPVPRRRLGAPGTHGAGVEVQRQRVQRIDAELPQVKARALKMFRAEMTQDALTTLDRILDGHHERRKGDGATSPKRALEHLINERGFASLAPAEAALFLSEIASGPDDVATTKAAIAIIKTRLPERLGSHQRAQLLSLFGALESDARAHMAQLAARKLHGRSALENSDTRDATLIHHLLELSKLTSTCPQMQSLGVKAPRVLNLVLSSLSSPERLPFAEGNRGVVGMMEFACASNTPSEYARIWRALVSSEMIADLPGDGKLDLGQWIRSKPGAKFSNQETPFRVALSSLAKKVAGRPRKPTETFIMPGGHGIDADLVSRSLTLLYGVGFTVAAGAETALRHLRRLPRNAQRVPPVFVSILYKRGERLFLFDRIESDTLYVRAPHGKSKKPAGSFRSDPRRAVVDPGAGIDSVPLDSFMTSAGVALVPRT